MATKKTAVEEEPTPDVAPEPVPVVFRDTVYTSRVLILPDSGRALPVVRHLVSVPEGDTVALEYLGQHPDLVKE